jgi:hypothetical protein
MDITKLIHKEIAELRKQNIPPKYLSVNTKGITELYLEMSYQIPEACFGLTVLYNPQQTTMVRILGDKPSTDFLCRKERYI